MKKKTHKPKAMKHDEQLNGFWRGFPKVEGTGHPLTSANLPSIVITLRCLTF